MNKALANLFRKIPDLINSNGLERNRPESNSRRSRVSKADFPLLTSTTTSLSMKLSHPSKVDRGCGSHLRGAGVIYGVWGSIMGCGGTSWGVGVIYVL